MAWWATGPDSAMPTRKAPTAADTFSCAASPATSRVSPNTPSSRASGSRAEMTLEIDAAVPDRHDQHDDRP